MTELTVGPGRTWLETLTRPDFDGFARAFTDDVRLETAVTSGILKGPAEVRRYFQTTKSMFQSIAFLSEASADNRTYLEWHGLYEECPISGVTILGKQKDGRISTIQIYYRPIEQVELFSTEVKSRLAAAP